MRFGFVNSDGGFGPFESLKDMYDHTCDPVMGTLDVGALIRSGYEIVPMEEEKDMINPDHYKVHKHECFREIKALLSPEEYRGWLKGSVLKYRYRTGHKDDPAQENSKSDWFMDKLMEELGMIEPDFVNRMEGEVSYGKDF